MRTVRNSLLLLLAAQLVVPNYLRAESQKKKVDQIAAVVGNEIILLSDVYEQAAPALKELNKAGASVSPVLLKSKKAPLNFLLLT